MRRVTRTEHDGSITVLADAFEGHRLNSPNDVVIKSDNSIWFSDPTYGIDSDYEGQQSPSEIGASNVYRIDGSSGAITRVVADRVKPNGLAFSPDESLLYVADTGATHVRGLPPTIWSYQVKGQTVGEASLFATCPDGLYDGFRCDIHGNIWTSAGRSVFCYAADGTHLGTIAIGEIVANVCFGGPRRNRLYICGQTSLYSIYLNTRAAV
jgi:gluconolactonase